MNSTAIPAPGAVARKPRMPRNVARLRPDDRIEFVATFVGHRVELIAQRCGGSKPEVFVGRAIGVARNYARNGYDLMFVTDSGHNTVFSTSSIRNILSLG